MEYVVAFLGGICALLFLRIMQLDDKITWLENSQGDAEWLERNIRALYTQLYNHKHEQPTGYVDRNSVK